MPSKPVCQIEDYALNKINVEWVSSEEKEDVPVKSKLVFSYQVGKNRENDRQYRLQFQISLQHVDAEGQKAELDQHLDHAAK